MTPSPDRQFQLDLPIAAPPEAVWRAVSEAGEIARWFAPRVEVQPGPGGRMVWDWGGGIAWPHTIERWEPGARLRTRYDSQVEVEGGGRAPLFVDFEVRGQGGATTLRLVHSGFGPDARFDEEFDGVSRGWSIELLSLRHYLEHHAGRDRALCRGTVAIEGTADEAWAALAGAPGLEGLRDARPGERVALSIGGAPVEGAVLGRAGSHELALDAENLGHGFLRVAVERCGGELMAWVWLGLWGRPAGEQRRYRDAIRALLARAFPSGRPAMTDGVEASA